MKKSKRGLSGIVIAILLVLLVIGIGAIIALYSHSLLSKIQKNSATDLSKQECTDNFKVDVAGCVNNTGNAIHLQIVNLGEDIPAESLLQIDYGDASTSTKILTLLNSEPIQTNLTSGLGQEVVIYPMENLNQTNINAVRVIPILIKNNIRILCENLEPYKIPQC